METIAISLIPFSFVLAFVAVAKAALKETEAKPLDLSKKAMGV